LNIEGLDVLEIPGGTTSVLQPPDVSVNKPFKSGMRKRWEEWIEKGKKEFTTKGNRKKASYELVCEWISETWKEISSNVLVKFFESTGLTLNSDNSKDHKMLHRLQTIIENRLDNIDKDEESIRLEDEENKNIMNMDMDDIDMNSMNIYDDMDDIDINGINIDDDIDDNMVYNKNSVNGEDIMDKYITDKEYN
ncbi:16116_t:CDS:1, partial [Acaulospora morrowiae]